MGILIKLYKEYKRSEVRQHKHFQQILWL